MNRLLGMLDNPHHSCRFVHIAGTNGKGSTSLILAALLQEAGYTVGRYSSPHVVGYYERFAINGREISPGQLQYYLDLVLARIENLHLPPQDHPTEFEILTAVAFLYFRDNRVDISVIESGMGGLEDATNCIQPLISIITTIDHDHSQFLGQTLTEIARHKAGIIKYNCPVVLGPMKETAHQVAIERAREMQARVYESKDIQFHSRSTGSFTGQTLDIQLPDRLIQDVFFSLPGDYQLANLACALTAMMILEEQTSSTPHEYIKKALGKLRIAGRLEILSREPLVVCDAAHNPQAAKALQASLLRLVPGQEKILICGMLDDKDASMMLRELGESAGACIITQPREERNQNWRRVADLWQTLYPSVICHQVQDISEAVSLGLSLLQPKAYLLITGSFYVIATARSIFGPRQ